MLSSEVPLNALLPILVTVDGKLTLLIELQSKKALFGIDTIPGANVTALSDSHPLKDIFLTVDGRDISSSFGQEVMLT